MTTAHSNVELSKQVEITGRLLPSQNRRALSIRIACKWCWFGEGSVMWAARREPSVSVACLPQLPGLGRHAARRGQRGRLRPRRPVPRLGPNGKQVLRWVRFSTARLFSLDVRCGRSSAFPLWWTSAPDTRHPAPYPPYFGQTWQIATVLPCFISFSWELITKNKCWRPLRAITSNVSDATNMYFLRICFVMKDFIIEFTLYTSHSKYNSRFR